MKQDKAVYVNGKWQLNAREDASDYEYHDGDWHPKKKKKQKITPKPQKRIKKMNCGAFPLGSIKEFCKTATLYLLSAALGMSLALNVFWYMENRSLERQNLQLLEVVQGQ
jgi:hypothetical protein